MRCDNVAAALADAAKEFGKLSIGIGGGDGLFHGAPIVVIQPTIPEMRIPG
jgi:hypothetical protein